MPDNNPYPQLLKQALNCVEANNNALKAAREIIESQQTDQTKIAQEVKKLVKEARDSDLISAVEEDELTKQASTHEGTLKVCRQVVDLYQQQSQKLASAEEFRKQAALGQGIDSEKNSEEDYIPANSAYAEKRGNYGRRRESDVVFLKGLGLPH